MASRPELVLLRSTLSAHLQAPGRLAEARRVAQALIAAPELSAPLAAGSYAGITHDLLGLADDVSVIDLHGFIGTVLSALTRSFRETALRRLYEFLDRYQEDIDRVNAYVELLNRRGLVQVTGQVGS